MFSSVKYLDGDKEEGTEITRPGRLLATFNTGDTFEGTYANEGRGLVRVGKGVYTWRSKAKYEGDYTDGKRHGYGKYTFPSGDVYEGSWKDGVKAGEGKYTYVNGDIFYGTWVDDKRNGKGRFVNANEKTEIHGVWQNGYVVKDSTTVQNITKANTKRPEKQESPKAVETKTESPKKAAPVAEESKPATPVEETSPVSTSKMEEKSATPMKEATPVVTPKSEEKPATPVEEERADMKTEKNALVAEEAPLKETAAKDEIGDTPPPKPQTNAPATIELEPPGTSAEETATATTENEPATDVPEVVEFDAVTKKDDQPELALIATKEEVAAEAAAKEVAAAKESTEKVEAVKNETEEVAPQKPLSIVIAGAPASGKGTQCSNIADTFGVIHLSTGDMLRAAVASKSEIGIKAKEYMDNGDLVPDEIVNEIIRERLEQDDVKEKGMLLDGYPRTKEQAEQLRELGVEIDVCLLLDVEDDLLIERAVGRRLDPVTQTIYHLTFHPPPDDEEVKARLVHRSDDTEESMVNRLEKFRANITSLREFYDEVLHVIDGGRDKSDVWGDINIILEKVSTPSS